VCLAAHETESRRWTTAVNVKLLLPPRQSRGTSFDVLGTEGSRATKPEQARLLRRTVLVIASLLVLFVAAFAAAIVFSTVNPPPPAAARQLDRTDPPPLSGYMARDGAVLAYRAYLGDDRQVVVLVHGTSTESSVMNAVAKTLRATGATVYALDMCGHGSSGSRGDIDYIGQLDDDIADFVATVRVIHSNASFTLLGFSGGASLAMRIAGSAFANLFDRYIAVSPAIEAVGRPNSYVAIALPRIVALVVLNQIGIHWFDGLTTIAFAIPPCNPNLTGAYSFRLMWNLANRDYLAGLRNARKPMTLIAGANDEQFRADRYAQLLTPAKPDLAVRIIPGLDHVDMITKPAGIAAIRQAFAQP
jgi:non-heme chloroperoxidase